MNRYYNIQLSVYVISVSLFNKVVELIKTCIINSESREVTRLSGTVTSMIIVQPAPTRMWHRTYCHVVLHGHDEFKALKVLSSIVESKCQGRGCCCIARPDTKVRMQDFSMVTFSCKHTATCAHYSDEDVVIPNIFRQHLRPTIYYIQVGFIRAVWSGCMGFANQ